MRSNMQRALRIIKDQSLQYQVVERWNQWSKKREDLFKIIDILVLDAGILGVQVTGSDLATHRKKISVDEKINTLGWLQNGGRLEIWSFRKLLKKRGGKAKYWNCKITDVLSVNNEIYFEEEK